MQPASTTHITGLNTLRFLAAFSLIVYHSTLNFQQHLPARLGLFLHNLSLGVDFFFLISGFLIVYLLLTERENVGRINLGHFFMRRLLRIFPLYYLVLLVAFIFYDASPASLICFATFTGNFWLIRNGDWTVGPVNPLWSLCIEEHFYLVIPFLVAYLPKSWIPKLFMVVVAISMIFRCAVFYEVQWYWMTLYCHSMSRMDVIALGGLMGWAYHKRCFRIRISRPVLLTTLVAFTLLLCRIDATNYDSLFNAVFKKYLYIAPMVVILLYWVLPSGSATPRRENKGLWYMGSISYGLYMWHTPVIDLLSGVSWINHSLILKPVVIIIVTSIVSIISFYMVEGPALRLKSYFQHIIAKE